MGADGIRDKDRCRDRARVGTSAGNGGITCVLHTPFSSFLSLLHIQGFISSILVMPLNLNSL